MSHCQGMLCSLQGGNKQTFFHICDSWMSMSFAAWLVGQVSASVQGSDALDCSGVHSLFGLWIPRHVWASFGEDSKRLGGSRSNCWILISWRSRRQCSKIWDFDPFESLHGRGWNVLDIAKNVLLGCLLCKALLLELQSSPKNVKKMFLVRVWQHWLLLISLLLFYTFLYAWLSHFSFSRLLRFWHCYFPTSRASCTTSSSVSGSWISWVDKVHSEIRTSCDSKSFKVELE